MQKWKFKWVTYYKADSTNVNSIIPKSYGGDGKKRYNGYDECEAYLDRLGSEGWELVSTVGSFDNNGRYLQLEFFFKQPV